MILYAHIKKYWKLFNKPRILIGKIKDIFIIAEILYRPSV